ncbi:hypothetical protein LRS13_18020 [Svornostia abyssi]|uniref:Uncharacterized protein n=1 Tax=Svornostia abyssi TaxID=2898438 RepID=A0ABY5PD37_9ACTN|nr:hypothetical protein LRS13_18020 [Parviterribacteraceae bacterium J379]
MLQRPEGDLVSRVEVNPPRYPVQLVLLVDVPVLGVALTTLGNALWGLPWCPDLGCDDASFWASLSLAGGRVIWVVALLVWASWVVERRVRRGTRPGDAVGGAWVSGPRPPTVRAAGAIVGLVGVAIVYVALRWDCAEADCADLVTSALWACGVGAVVWAMSWWSRWPLHMLVGATLAFTAALAGLVAA